MKNQDLQERSDKELVELASQVRRDLFSYRMKNHMGQLDDTSLIKKSRRDIARINGVISARAKEGSSK
jgi:large subunit ribosomal protein L29